MSKALRIKIINYLREKDAVAKYVDIREHVLSEKDSVEERNELKATLDYLSNKRLIAINGTYEFLHWTATYGLYNIDNKIIATKLTKAGQSYHPENESDDMEATVQPVLAIIKKKGDTGQQVQQDILVAPTSTFDVKAEPVQLPWYVAPEKEAEILPEPVKPVDEQPLPWYIPEPVKPIDEQPLPWYVEPTKEEAELLPDAIKPIDEQPLPWYVEPIKEEAEIVAEPLMPIDEQPLPWYVEPVKEEKLAEPIKPIDEQPLPWYVAPKQEEADAFEAEMLEDDIEIKTEAPKEPELPWYKAPETVETPKPLHNALKELEEYVPLQPWYVEPVKEDAPVSIPKPESVAKVVEPEPPLPWEAEVKQPVAEEPKPIAEEKKEPVIYRFPPIEPKPEAMTKTPAHAPMAIEVLNENLSNSIDVISNIKLKKPAMLTGDFEKDTNVVLKFILVVVLFLLFGCIVWLYMG
ncbi:hypothetical protein KXQ82_08990 [Mucilaginibacter sp. HMF5004]|uniref:hypothetical protein n=1 Tax=Mucilaginibacter rivuli TaxID=2857527 RepID=UPI001C5CC950|nr:hypothetical protein [Mucilaginibacter rivuli]MBW4889850.1 hypothetical protein [Mucilaginibacter rivuli]